MRIVKADKTFKFRRLCPYCKGNLTYVATGWVQDDGKYPRKLKKRLKKRNSWPLWEATDLESECSNEPDDILSLEWDDWLTQHTNMPYVYQMPVDNKVQRFISKRYRFNL